MDNQKLPKRKKQSKVIIKLFLILALCLPLWARGTTERELPDRPRLDAKKVSQKIVYYTNIERLKAALPLFRYHPLLEQGSVVHSNYMAQNRIMTHGERILKQPEDRVRSVCEGDAKVCMDQFYVPRTGTFRVCCSENVIESFDKNSAGVPYYIKKDEKGQFREWTKPVTWYNEESLACDMVKRWMNSPGHRANILDRQSAAMGAAIAFDLKETYYGTQVFSPFKKGPVILDNMYTVETLKAEKETDPIQILYSPRGELAKWNVYIKPLSGIDVKFQVQKTDKGSILKVSDAPSGKKIIFRVEHQDSDYPAVFYPICQFSVVNNNGKWSWDWQEWE